MNICNVKCVICVKISAVNGNPYFSYCSTLSLITIYFRHCGVIDPSWSELGHFVQFLNLQFLSCEASVFCDEAHVGDVMAGLKTFVVKFMIRMSKVNGH